MRLLMTQRELVGFHGSEMVTVEVAREMAERGHEITVFSPRLGRVAKLLWPSGVRTVSRLDEVPWTPDLIHAHHHLPAMAAMARFERTPAIYYCHGAIPWVEQPPMHERIRWYVMMCDWMVRRVIAEFGLDPGRVACVPNFVNTTRFSEVRVPPAQLRRALLFQSSGLAANDLSQLESGCAALGLELDKIGAAYGNAQSRPEMLLQHYDLVFASGKSALEAMATGCAVMTLAPTQAGALVTTENFDTWSFANFAPRYYSGATPINEAWLRREVALYSADDAAEVTAKVRRERTLKAAGDQLEGLYRTALESGVSGTASASFAPYLERMASEVDTLWGEREGMQALREHIAFLESKLAPPAAVDIQPESQKLPESETQPESDIPPESGVQPPAGKLPNLKDIFKSIFPKRGA
ncbi:glycosyltransferase family 4 protein [Mesorhizobium sp. GbtcB19]|uniref:glycosyltransferase n=1 Tax=Mesorhizobium sp. GbtcB19 TaxID=2824764 RepID=UPI001C3108B1|nr:glycosyltransferase family 4 protein [Mesorhizobium sp. GbtcB19]